MNGDPQPEMAPDSEPGPGIGLNGPRRGVSDAVILAAWAMASWDGRSMRCWARWGEQFAADAGADLDRLVLNVSGWNKLASS